MFHWLRVFLLCVLIQRLRFLPVPPLDGNQKDKLRSFVLFFSAGPPTHASSFFPTPGTQSLLSVWRKKKERGAKCTLFFCSFCGKARGGCDSNSKIARPCSGGPVWEICVLASSENTNSSSNPRGLAWRHEYFYIHTFICSYQTHARCCWWR